MDFTHSILPVRHSVEILKPEDSPDDEAVRLQTETQRAQKSLQLSIQKPSQSHLEETPTRQAFHRKKQTVQVDEPLSLCLRSKEVKILTLKENVYVETS